MINPETYNWDDLPENIEKAKQIRKNISEAGAVISDAILRYKKKKINARSKRKLPTWRWRSKISTSTAAAEK